MNSIYKTRHREASERRTKLRTDGNRDRRFKASGPPKPKLGPKTRCVTCRHYHRDHCLQTITHENDGAFIHPAIAKETPPGWHTCVSTHCSAGLGASNQRCSCLCFREKESDPWEMKPRKNTTAEGIPCDDEWQKCVTCQHPRRHHCTKRREPNEEPKGKTAGKWKGFEVDGQPFVCVHTTQNVNYMCTSSHCAEGERDASGKVTFCFCEKYVNPQPRKRATTPRAPRRRKEKIPFMTGQMSLLVADSEVHPLTHKTGSAFAGAATDNLQP